MTNRQINRIGDSLRKPESRNHALLELARYTTQFYDDLTFIQQICKKAATTIEKGAIIVSRFKRFESIESKLLRFPSMNLAQIQDIGGCRVIFSEERSVYLLVDKLKTLSGYSLKEVDYIKNPRDSGYQSYHIILENNLSKRKIELQLRTRDQHNWATLVEITDLVFSTQLKENQKPDDFQAALKILSKPNDQIEYEELVSLIKFVVQKQYVKKLMTVFIQNIDRAEMTWKNSNPNRSKTTFVLTVPSEGVFKMSSYMSRKKAEKKFLEGYLSRNNDTSVLINLLEPDFNKLVFAYSNYILIGNEFVLRIQTLMIKLLDCYMDRGNMLKFAYLYANLLNFYELELDWALAYLKGSKLERRNFHVRPSLRSSAFGRLMVARIKSLVDNLEQFSKLVKERKPIYSSLLSGARLGFNSIGSGSRKKKIEEIKRILEE